MTTFRFGKQHWREFGEKEYEIIKKERQERNEILSKSDRTKGMWGKGSGSIALNFNENRMSCLRKT